jgi:flagellar M-ring protein FliF
MLGAGNVRAQVSADIDFSRTEQTSETFKPNPNPASKTIRSEQNSTATSTSGQNGGIPGALTNQPPVPATAPIVAGAGTSGGQSSAGPSSQQKESTINYEVDRTIRHTVLPVGSIKRLSVAVVVNGNRMVTDAKGKASNNPLSDTEKEQINNLVREAMGFDQKRGDSLNVQVAAFSEIKEIIEAIPFWKQPYVIELLRETIKYLLIAVAMLFVMFGIIRPAFRALFPAPKTEEELAEGIASTLKEPQETGAETGAQFTPAIAPYEQNLQIARQIAQQEPKIAASVIKEWVKE